jgi:hypothetical protein
MSVWKWLLVSGGVSMVLVAILVFAILVTAP